MIFPSKTHFHDFLNATSAAGQRFAEVIRKLNFSRYFVTPDSGSAGTTIVAFIHPRR